MQAAARILLAAGLCLTAGTSGKEVTKVDKNLWAAITVNRVIFVAGHLQGERVQPRIGGEVTEHLMIHFVVVNDGDKSINPDIVSSQLLVNGKELPDWPWIISNGPRDARFEAIPPGEHLLFSVALGKYFAKPGVYRVAWKGKSFWSPEIVFRVMGKKEK